MARNPRLTLHVRPDLDGVRIWAEVLALRAVCRKLIEEKRAGSAALPTKADRGATNADKSAEAPVERE